MLTVAQFAADSHLGNLFGAKGPLYGPSGHRGLDINRWPVGTGIPWIGTGPVVRSEWQVGLGWVVTIADPRGVFISNCHMQSKGVPVGKVIRYINEYAGPLGNTGLLSRGAHDHIVVSRTSSNPASGSVIDPRPFVNAAKLATAGSGGVLMDPAELLEEPERNRTMRTIKIVKSSDAAMNLAAWPVGGRYLVTDAGITAHPTSALGYGLANRVAGFEIAEDQECFGAEAQALLEMLHVINAPGGGSVGVSVADREAIAAEVIRQQKLPGN